MEILAYILSLSGLASMITASLIKGEKMKKILFFVFCANALIATSYLVDGSGLNGAASCYIGAIQSIINYSFDSKNKPLPKWLVAVYALAFIACNLVVGGFNFLSILAIVACLTFIMSIGQSNGAKYRFWTLFNITLWGIYDILSESYSALVTHVILLVFTIVGMIVHDRKKKDKV